MDKQKLKFMLDDIESAEATLRKSRKVLLFVQHRYLEAMGIEIKQDEDGDIQYQLGNNYFFDADHAIEYLEEQGD